MKYNMYSLIFKIIALAFARTTVLVGAKYAAAWGGRYKY
jgi:hypothetical protein